MKYKTFFLTLFLVIFFIYGYGSSSTKDSVATIKIKAMEFKDRSWNYFSVPGIELLPVKLDSNGEGMISLAAKKKFTFILMYGYEKIPYTIFLEPGDDMTLSIVNGKSIFSGKGAPVNNFLVKTKEPFIKLRDSIAAIKDPLIGIEKFIHSVNHCESELASLYKKYYDSVLPTKEVDYLLRADMQAFVLWKKEEFLSRFEQKKIDSLNLENKLGLTVNNLLNDTLLIKFPSSNFTAYLNTNNRRYLSKTVSLSSTDRYKNAIMLHNAVESASQYSRQIKTFLTYYNIYWDLVGGGPNPVTDSISDEFKRKYPSATEYHALLDNLYQTFSHLMPGKPAPHLQGISPEGKVGSLNDFKGKVIFIDIWATWCSPCIKALPHILELQNSFSNNKEVVFIFLSHDKEEEWKKYLSEHPEFKGTHLRSRKEDYSYQDLWKVGGIPRYMIVDQQGKIVNAFAKWLSYEELKNVIEKTLLK